MQPQAVREQSSTRSKDRHDRIAPTRRPAGSRGTRQSACSPLLPPSNSFGRTGSGRHQGARQQCYPRPRTPPPATATATALGDMQLATGMPLLAIIIVDVLAAPSPADTTWTGYRRLGDSDVPYSKDLARYPSSTAARAACTARPDCR